MSGGAIVGWLTRTQADVPAGEAWLSRGERAVLAALRVPKRAGDFRLGRWTARCALERAFGAGAWSIRAREDGSPEPLLDGEPADVELSLSHSHGVAMAAVVAGASRRIGCDVERVEPRDPALVEQFFTDQERARLADADAR